MYSSPELNYEDTYFGDDDTQKKAIDSLSSGVRSGSAAHLVFGGKRSGKSSVIEQVMEDLTKGGAFAKVKKTDAKRYLNGKPLKDVKNALLGFAACDELNANSKLGDVTLFQSGDIPPHRVLFVSEEILLPEDMDGLKPLTEALKALPLENGSLSVVLDATQLFESILPGVAPREPKKRYQAGETQMQNLARECPGLSIHRTAYKRAQIKEALWKMREEGTSLAHLRTALGDIFHVDVQDISIVNLLNAWQEGDRGKFDLAFERVPSAAITR